MFVQLSIFANKTKLNVTLQMHHKCEWYEHSEKPTKFFLNLEKQRGAQNTMKKLIVDDKEIIDQTHILGYVREFYETQTKSCGRN